MRIYNNLKIKNPTTGIFESVPAIFGGMPNQCAYNLLDNSYFVNPINQRGQTSYIGSGVYSIDRWKTSSTTTITVNEGYVNLNNTSTSSRQSFVQIIENGFSRLSGKTVTIALCDINNNVICNSGTIPTEIPSKDTDFCKVNYSTESGIKITITSSGDLHFAIMVAKSGTIDLKWAALYEGEYTAETLPPYIYKGYAAELAECQMYYKKFTTETTQNVSFAIGMARSATSIVAMIDVGNMLYNPDVTSVNMSYTGSLKALGANTLTGLTPTRDTYMTGGLVRLNFATSGATIGNTYLLASESNGFSIEFSSDL